MGKNSAQVLPLTAGDVAGLASQVRPADREEIEAATGLPIGEALLLLLPGSCKASKIVHRGLVLAVFGDAEHGSGVGVPWLISTIHVEQHPREFLRVCRPAVMEMLERHQQLLNYVDARNTVAIRWLRWLGFKFGDAVPYGHAGLPFFQFGMTREV